MTTELLRRALVDVEFKQRRTERMNWKIKAAIGAAALVAAAQASAQIVFYEHDGFRGRSFSTAGPVDNLERFRFNNRAASIVVDHGRWEVCEGRHFEGRCVVLRPGRYDTLEPMGLAYRISSVRPAGRHEVAYIEAAPPGPPPAPVYAEPPQPAPVYAAPPPPERLFQARVMNVRAMMGPPERRCWVEKQPVATAPGPANAAGAVIGGILGGVLGHQVGAGRGKDVATVGGAIAGAAVGANVGREPGVVTSQDVERCHDVRNEQPAYYDVTYDFDGQVHHVQTPRPPGPTITVNDRGEPRV
jgi:hypothetical protein